MSAAYYIILERQIPGLNHIVNGKALPRVGETLREIANKCGVQPLMDFFSASPEEVAGVAHDHDIALSVPVPSERWFSADEGLVTLAALITEAEKERVGLGVIDELRDFQRVLEAAKLHGIRWHLAVDF